MITVLVMGLPDSGKSTFAAKLQQQLGTHGVTSQWHNADALRTQHNDWDFSPEGRLRQAHRMKGAAAASHSSGVQVSILDFVCPDPFYREVVDPDVIVCMETRASSVYQDTNSAFCRVTPKEAETIDASLYHVTSFEEESAILQRVTTTCLSILRGTELRRPGLLRRLILAFRGA